MLVGCRETRAPDGQPYSTNGRRRVRMVQCSFVPMIGREEQLHARHISIGCSFLYALLPYDRQTVGRRLASTCPYLQGRPRPGPRTPGMSCLFFRLHRETGPGCQAIYTPPPARHALGGGPQCTRIFSKERMADAAGVAAVLQPPRRAPAAQERFKWTPKQSLSYLATFFVATWLGAFLVTFLLVQVLLRMS